MRSSLNSAISSAADAEGAAAVGLVARPYGWLGTFQAMASPCEVHVAHADRALALTVVERAAHEAWRVEQKWSRYRPDNIVHRINTAAGEPVTVDEETARLIDYAAELTALSDAFFDITSGVLRKVWRFDGSDRLPTRSAVKRQVARVGWHRVHWQRPVLTMPPGMQVDFGGIGKEYAVDRAAAAAAPLVRDCLINFGGDLLALGPSAGGVPWAVGVEHVRGPGAPALRIEIARGGIATSGDARRFLEKDGKRYSHILDPHTGWPVEGAPRSVTVAADTCTQAGMLATFALLNGRDAEAFLARQGVRHWCLR
jgi:thiamine biosynthesis lipoprotein